MARSPISIVVAASGPWASTRRCLDALRATLGVRDQVVVATAGPPDPPLARYPWVEAVQAAPGSGPWALREAGAASSRHGIVVFLSDDAVPSGHWIDPLVRELRHDGVGAAGPRSNRAAGVQLVPAGYCGRKAMRDFARRWCEQHRGQAGDAPCLADFCFALRSSTIEALAQPGGGAARLDGEIWAQLAARGSRLRVCHDSFVHREDPSAEVLVSACLITKDEQANLPACLGSLRKFADEIVIYDTGSTDGTVRLAREMGATVIEGYWDDDFSRARNAALVHCRGEWIAWLDADETLVCDDIAALRELLVLTKPDIDGWSVPIDNATGVGAGTSFVHHACRLFRRDHCEWTGRLHEQIARRGNHGAISQAIMEAASLRHTGYLDEVWRSRNKTERNLRVAAAEAEAADGSNPGYALLNLARASLTAGRLEQALEAANGALAQTDNRITRRMALRTAAESLLRMGHTDDALEWTARLRAACTNPLQADVTEAKIRLQRGEYRSALECLDRVGAGGRDEDGFSHEPAQFAAQRAEALAGLGSFGAAADTLLASLRDRQALDLHLGSLLEYLERAGRPAAELAAAIPAGKAPLFLAQALQLRPDRADAVLEACAERMPAKTAVLAAAASLAPRLGVERALVWSSRLRAAGLADACPLIAMAAAGRDSVERARAAAVAHRMFSDGRAPGAYRSAVADAAAAARVQIRQETAALCPDLLGLFAEAAAASAPAAGVAPLAV